MTRPAYTRLKSAGPAGGGRAEEVPAAGRQLAPAAAAPPPLETPRPSPPAQSDAFTRAAVQSGEAVTRYRTPRQKKASGWWWWWWVGG